MAGASPILFGNPLFCFVVIVTENQLVITYSYCSIGLVVKMLLLVYLSVSCLHDTNPILVLICNPPLSNNIHHSSAWLTCLIYDIV